MYDFCFSYPFAGLLAFGGLMGFVTKGSTASLGAGLACATIIGGCGYMSLQNYYKGKTCKPATAVSLVVSLVLAYAMRARYNATGKFMPAGLTMVLR